MSLRKQIEHMSFLFEQGGSKKLFDHIRENVLFDLKHGTNTTSWLETKDFHPAPPNLEHGVKYRAASTSEIERGIKIAKQYVNPEEAGFYDLGCGKGKVLCLASLQHNFNSLTGVDYYPPFIEIAKRNFAEIGSQEINIEYSDMSEFKNFDKQSVVFLYNPADNTVIDKVRQNLEQHTEKSVVIYNKPVHAEIFEGWNLVSSKKDSDPDHCTDIYTFG